MSRARGTIPMDFPDRRSDPEMLFCQKESYQRLFSAIACLNPDARAAIELTDLEEQSNAAVALQLGCDSKCSAMRASWILRPRELCGSWLIRFYPTPFAEVERISGKRYRDATLFRCSWSWRGNSAIRAGSFIHQITSPSYAADSESASKASQMANRDSDTAKAKGHSWEDNGRTLSGNSCRTFTDGRVSIVLNDSISAKALRPVCDSREQAAHGNPAIQRQAVVIATTLPSRRALISRMGGRPKNRLYSRLNWLGLS